jgi:hypothetical protein
MEQINGINLELIGIFNGIVFWPQSPLVVEWIDNEKIIAIKAEPDQIAQGQLWPDIAQVQTAKLAVRYRHDRGPIGLWRPKIGLDFIEAAYLLACDVSFQICPRSALREAKDIDSGS